MFSNTGQQETMPHTQSLGIRLLSVRFLFRASGISSKIWLEEFGSHFLGAPDPQFCRLVGIGGETSGPYFSIYCDELTLH